MPTFGPGVLKIGGASSAIDASCLVNSLRITSSKDEGDSTTKLCGTIRPGKVTYTFTLTGNVDTDTDDPEGLFALSQLSPGTQTEFTFTPNTEGETTATGTLIIDPLDFGADEFGDDLTSDFEFAIIGQPTYTFPAEALTRGYQPTIIRGRQTPGATAPDVSQDTAGTDVSQDTGPMETTTAKAKQKAA